MKTIRDLDIRNKRVLIRCDFNLPVVDGKIGSDFRIRQTLPTLKYAKEQGAHLVLMSHLGDDGDLAPVWEIVKRYIGAEDVVFLDNLRLNKREEENSDEFAKELASKGDVYINDAFGVCHREHASVSAITKFLPSAAGFLLEKEVEVLSKVLDNPARPLVAVIGGVKVSSKSKVINKFLQIADHLLIGGKLANTLLAAKGIVADGFDKDELKEAEKIDYVSSKIHLPVDVAATSGEADIRNTAPGKVKGKELILDIGQETISIFSEIIKEAGTIVWAGPLGFFERKPFDKGTREVAESICNNLNALKVAGGGDTVSAVEAFHMEEKFNHLSTGGGAMLAFLGGEELPGLKALNYYAESRN